MSGCGSSNIVDIPATITDLSIPGTSPHSGDIEFSFTYTDNEDQDAEIIVEYELDGSDNWETASVLASEGATTTADLTNLDPGDYVFYWDSVADGIGSNTYNLRVRPDQLNAIYDIEGDPVVVNNL